MKRQKFRKVTLLPLKNSCVDVSSLRNLSHTPAIEVMENALNWLYEWCGQNLTTQRKKGVDT